MNGKMKQIAGKVTVGMFAAAASFFLLANLPAVVTNVNAASGVDINSDTFPDENFRKYVSEECDGNHDDYLSEAEINAVRKINVYDKDISKLDGIEYFTAIEELDCSDNQLTSIDVSKNTDLTDFNCSDNQLTSLDVSRNIALEYLECSANQLTSLDVSKNTALEYLYCEENQLTSLDVSKNTTLECLYCDDNQLSSLDVTNNIDLKGLGFSDNRIESIDISNNTVLEFLYCYNNPLDCVSIVNNSYLLEAYEAGENITYRWEEYPDSAILYGVEGKAYLERGLVIDRSTIVFTKTAGPGWLEVDGNWFYVIEDAAFTTGWQKIGNSWYYFDEEGIMQTGWFEDGGSWYYLTSSGAMATGWQEVSGSWYYFDVSGKMKTGWQKIGGKDYFLKPNGAMASDEYVDGYYLDKSGAWTYKYRASWKSDSKGTYFQDTKGWYPKNQWLLIDDQWYFFKPDGYRAASEYWNGYWFNLNGGWTYTPRASWKKDTKGWYYQDTAGWYPRDCSVKIDGKNYNFDISGYCTNP